MLYVVIGPVVIIGVYYYFRNKNTDLEKFRTPNPPEDVVLLHQYGPAPFVPSISPFVVKVETYLRVAGIKYENVCDRKPGPKGKLPWIQLNNEVIADSEHIVEHLREKMNVQLNKNLTPTQLASGHLLRRAAEESLYWTLLVWRLVYETKGLVYRLLGLPSIVIWYLRRKARQGLHLQGISRHSQSEVCKMMEDDLAAISTFIGTNRFLFGSARSDVTEYDCALFGQLSQLVWQMPGCPVQDLICDKYPSIVKFCETMKQEFWPDWDQRLKKPVKMEKYK